MKRILRRTSALAAVMAALAVFYYLGSRYLWPEPDNGIIEVVGIIEAPEVNISSRIAGRIKELSLIEGDTVERGQAVCRIEDADIRNRLIQARGDLEKAEADARKAERNYARNRKLFANHVISAKERDDALADLERDRGSVLAATGQVQLYNDQLSDTVIRSPISGVVVSKNLELGEWANPGTPILTVDDLSTVWVRVDVPETELGSIKLGEPARVTVPTHPPLIFEGRVMAIGQEGQFATERDVRRGRQDIRTFYVKVRVLKAEGTLKPGMTAEVSFSRHDAINVSGNTGAGTD